MKISLIIATYNNPDYLKKVLDSIAIQQRLPDEVIIADDGSGPDTAEVIKDFAGIVQFPVIHVWHEDKGFRLAKIRNEAIKKSSGEYIILLDGDCVANKYLIGDHLKLSERGHFIQGKRAHVSRDAVAFFNADYANSFSKSVSLALTGKISNTHHLLRLPQFRPFRNRRLKGIMSFNMSFFRDDIFAVNGFNENFTSWGNEDSELACRFFKYGLVKKVHLFMATCFHLWHETNKSPNKNNDLLLETMSKNEYFCENGIVKRQ